MSENHIREGTDVSPQRRLRLLNGIVALETRVVGKTRGKRVGMPCKINYCRYKGSVTTDEYNQAKWISES